MSLKKYLYHAAAAVFSIPVVLPLTIFAFDRTPQFTLADGGTIPPELRARQPYSFNWTLVPLRADACEGTVFWKIIDSKGTVWATPPTPSLFVNLEMKKNKHIAGRERVLPSGIPPGRITLQASIEFICNPLHHIWPVKVSFPAITSMVVDEKK